MNDQENINYLKVIISEINSLQFEEEGKKDKIQKRAELFIRKTYGWESHYLSDLKGTSFKYDASMWVSGVSYEPKFRNAWEEGKQIWINLCETMIEEIVTFPEKNNLPSENKPNDKYTNTIFIVHGHDNEMVHATARFIEKLGLEPIILREQPNGGRTIIEKFEVFANVNYAIILFSPDDEGKAKQDSLGSLHPRPRQNVIFELGFFIGKLGRKNVAVLFNEANNFEILSDFNGILYHPYKDGWELSIAKDLKAAGFEIDLNRLA